MPAVMRPVKRAYEMLGECSVRRLFRCLRFDSLYSELSDAMMPPERAPPKRIRFNAISSLLRLDSPVDPGLKPEEFRALFRQCSCKLITTRLAFASHFCISQVGQLRERGRTLTVFEGATGSNDVKKSTDREDSTHSDREEDSTHSDDKEDSTPSDDDESLASTVTDMEDNIED